MRKLIAGIRTLFVCLAFVRTASHEEQNMNTNSQNFLEELKHDIKLCKEHDKSKNTNGYTMFRVTGKRMEVGDFYRLCQSLPTLTDSNGMISIITVRDLNIDKVYGEDSYFEELTNAILGYINKNEDYVMLGTLGVTVDYIDKEQIEYFDAENAIFEQIYNSHLIMSRLVMTFFYEICIDAFKDIIIGLVKKSLLEWSTTIYPNHPPVQSDDENFFNRAKDKLAADLQLVLTNNNCINWVAFNYARKESAFDSVYQIVCENEKVNGLNHFASNICAAHLFYEYLILDQYGSLFKQGIDDIISKYVLLLQNDDYKEYFYDFSYDSMENLNVFYEQDHNYIDESRYYNWALDSFCETENFLVSFYNYFEQIYTYAFAHQHRNLFQPRTDSLTCEVGSENVTNIIYSGPIDNENIRSLLNALRETSVFDKISQHQYIYLDDRKILSESAANTFAATCDRVRFDASIRLQRVELIAKIKPETENSRASSVNKSIYKRHVFGNDEDSMEYEDTNVVLSKTVLTIKNSTDLANTEIGESIVGKISLCLVKNRSKMVDTNMISVSTDLGVSMICILRHETIETPIINVSLVYDVPVGNFLSDEGHSSQAARLVRVLDNVPLSFLNDLQYQLRRMQLMDGISFTPPNFFTLKNIDLIYKNVTVEIGGPYETKIDIDFLLGKLNCKPKCYHSHCQLTFDQILEFEVKQTHGCEEISEIVKKIWLVERDLNQILLKFMPFFYTGNIVGDEPCSRYKHSTSRKIELFVTGSYNDGMILHLCELQNYHYYQNITYNPLVVLAKILKTTNNSSAQKIVKESMTSYASFFPLLSIDVCKRLQNLVSNKVWANIRPGNVEIVRFIYVYIENVFASYLHQNDFNNRDVNDGYKARESECIKLQKLISFDEIIDLAKDIQKCLHKIIKNRKVQVVSIKINRIRDEYELKTKGKMLCESDEHFEDVSVFARNK